MNPILLSDAVQRFIVDHENDDEMKLVLKHKSLFRLPASLIAQQISGRKKAKDKLPTFYCTPAIIYPPGLNIEQSSSEKTARYKAEILKTACPERSHLIDLTGGLGVDTHAFGKIFDAVTYVEPDEELYKISQHNHKMLGLKNINHYQDSAEHFLEREPTQADVMYIDPSRRSSGNQKLFRLCDCIPDVTSLQESIFKTASWLLVKASPLFDLQQGVRELKNVHTIFIISVSNDCKELLFLCKKGFVNEPDIHAVNLTKLGKEFFSFTFSEEKSASVFFADVKHYLFEPNASILKAGAFKMLAQVFDLNKLQANSHLYTSDKINMDFPGRIFKIENLIKNDARIIAEYFPDRKANIIVRNYPLRADQLKQKLRLSDGGERYLIATSTEKQRILCAATRIK